MLQQKRESFRVLERKTGSVFSRFNLSPNQYTLASLLFAGISFYFLTRLRFVPALIFFALAAFLDFIDGAVARTTNRATKKGAYLDTVCDRYVEGISLLGFLFIPLPDIIFSSKIWIFLALFGSLMTTYSKAAAKEKEIITKELKIGFIGRGERMILVFFAMLLGIVNLYFTAYLIVLFAVLTNITAVQRICLTLGPGKC